MYLTLLIRQQRSVMGGGRHCCAAPVGTGTGRALIVLRRLALLARVARPECRDAAPSGEPHPGTGLPKCWTASCKAARRSVLLPCRRDLPARKRPVPEDGVTARRVLLDGLARDADISGLVSELAPMHPRQYLP